MASVEQSGMLLLHRIYLDKRWSNEGDATKEVKRSTSNEGVAIPLNQHALPYPNKGRPATQKQQRCRGLLLLAQCE
ncbi:hypothetical protein DEO72_LG9g2049 [Vigna unguiculata]|uniref:Uncharacterized protein n=1 Tax=Vigna unguiculata TaxID=3917 RepID=A0A4D6N2D7_VIGUN|nr:hypothetical protein DEO72_LG9g2049 [Vigna unguiculata]